MTSINLLIYTCSNDSSFYAFTIKTKDIEWSKDLHKFTKSGGCKL